MILKGGHLVTISDQDESDFIAQKFDSGDYWIGISDNIHQGEWNWVGGESSSYEVRKEEIICVTLKNWVESPESSSTNHCGRITSSDYPKWISDDCGSTFAYICEKASAGTTSGKLFSFFFQK